MYHPNIEQRKLCENIVQEIMPDNQKKHKEIVEEILEIGCDYSEKTLRSITNAVRAYFI